MFSKPNHFTLIPLLIRNQTQLTQISVTIFVIINIIANNIEDKGTLRHVTSFVSETWGSFEFFGTR